MSSSRIAGSRHDALLLLPLLAAIVFVQMFARALPLTDEWLYLHAIRKLHDVDLLSLSGIAQALQLYPTKFSDHLVGFPFVLYWPISEWSHFDSRWIIYLSVAAFATQAWLFRRYLVGSPGWSLPVGLLLLCPSHYMEFLWGWQVTLSFSIVFPILGLVILDGLSPALRPASQARRLAAAIACMLAGSLSSAGAFFGFVAATALVLAKPIRPRAKIVAVAALASVGMPVYYTLIQGTTSEVAFGSWQVGHALTALGAVLWGSPVALYDFRLDLRSTAGLVIVACIGAVVVRARVRRLLPTIDLPLAITLFGSLCLVSIATTRPYLGNWHVQYALPVLCGGYAAAYGLWTRDKSVYSRVPFFGLCALIVSCLAGYISGFGLYGPEYRAYVGAIEHHVKCSLVELGLPAPYPPQGKRDLDARSVLFLSAYEHRLFADEPPPSAVTRLPENARVYLDGLPVSAPWRLSGDRGKLALLTVVLRDAPRARGVLAKIGDAALTLRRVHPRHVPAEIAPTPDENCFMGILVPHLLPDGDQLPELYMFE